MHCNRGNFPHYLFVLSKLGNPCKMLRSLYPASFPRPLCFSWLFVDYKPTVMQELCAANSGFEDSSMYPPASGANNIMHHVVSVGFVLAAEPISGRFDAIYLLEILMPEPAADKGQKPLFHSPIHCSPPFRNSGLSWIKSSYRCLTQPQSNRKYRDI